MRNDKVDLNLKLRKLLPPLTRSPFLSEEGFYGGAQPKAPSERELAPKVTEGECVTIKLI